MQRPLSQTLHYGMYADTLTLSRIRVILARPELLSIFSARVGSFTVFVTISWAAPSLFRRLMSTVAALRRPQHSPLSDSCRPPGGDILSMHKRLLKPLPPEIFLLYDESFRHQKEGVPIVKAPITLALSKYVPLMGS